MEQRFRYDFSSVRIHEDRDAARSARTLNARAFTVGNHIVFGQDQYQPQSASGKRLLAHELAHVAQQGHAGTSIQRDPSPDSPETSGTIASEDVAGIIAEQMQMWYTASRFGIQNAEIKGDDDAEKFFFLALAGNLVWAASTFVAPEAVIAIRLMSVAGATVGSGTIEKLAAEDVPVKDFRSKVTSSLGRAYRSLLDNRPALTTALQEIYVHNGLTNRNDAVQAEKRRKLAWGYLFRSGIGYANPTDLENQVKADVEAIWKFFLLYYRSLHTIITPTFIRKDMGRYILVSYYRALVASGVADRSIGVKKTTLYAASDAGEGMIGLTWAGDTYEFPGGATAKKTPYMQHLWFGNITATVP